MNRKPDDNPVDALLDRMEAAYLEAWRDGVHVGATAAQERRSPWIGALMMAPFWIALGFVLGRLA